jgi:hypothetical protein
MDEQAVVYAIPETGGGTGGDNWDGITFGLKKY